MTEQDDLLVRIHGEWKGWQSAEVRLGDLRDVHWHQPVTAPHQLVHAVVSCANIVTGEIPHECDRRSAPHDLLVCVLKRHALPTVYAELARRADATRRHPEGESPWRMRKAVTCSSPM